MNTLKQIHQYRLALQKWKQAGESRVNLPDSFAGREPTPADFGLTDPAARIICERVRQEIFGVKQYPELPHHD